MHALDEQRSPSLEVVLHGVLPDVEAAVRAGLGAEGFGVLTEIDVAKTLEAKLGVHRAPLRILGACNPALAHRALELDPSTALVLPCNVVLAEEGAGRVRVVVADPRAMLVGAGVRTPELEALAGDAARALERAVARIGADGG